MNDYVTLDGKKYTATHGKWTEVIVVPATIRKTLSGVTDVTYGPATYQEWRGEMRAYPGTPPVGYGTWSDLKTSLQSLAGLSFTDHFGNAHTVHFGGEAHNTSLSPVWDQDSGKMFVMVRLVKE